MDKKRFTVHKKLENSYIESDIIDFYVEDLIKKGKEIEDVSVGILNDGEPMTYKECVNLLNKFLSSIGEYEKNVRKLEKENFKLKEELENYKFVRHTELVHHRIIEDELNEDVKNYFNEECEAWGYNDIENLMEQLII